MSQIGEQCKLCGKPWLPGLHGGVYHDCRVQDPIEEVVKLRKENDRLRAALRYWLPDETQIPVSHEIAWNEHVQLVPEHRRANNGYEQPSK